MAVVLREQVKLFNMVILPYIKYHSLNWHDTLLLMILCNIVTRFNLVMVDDPLKEITFHADRSQVWSLLMKLSSANWPILENGQWGVEPCWGR